MLSLPLITPRDDLSIWRTSALSPSGSGDPSDPANNHHPHSHPNAAAASGGGNGAHSHSHSRRLGHAHSAAHAALLRLAADEATLAQRKLNVRRFGASWIRPPGIPKTFQAQLDEAAEREEQEMLARREQMMMELANAAEGEDAEALRDDADQAAEEANEVDRDLDDEVPDADEEDDDDDDEDDEDEDEDDSDVDEEGMVTFNEESFIDGGSSLVEHMLELEEAEITGALQDERDLDDDVPEAGSYQHTDTELEDDSSFGVTASGGRDSTGRFSFGAPGAAPGSGGLFSRGAAVGGGLFGNRGAAGGGNMFSRTLGGAGQGGRRSLVSDDGSSMLGGGSSSLLGSSPAAGRGPAGASGSGQGRLGRGQRLFQRRQQ